jgi:hypothetical protein
MWVYCQPVPITPHDAAELAGVDMLPERDESMMQRGYYFTVTEDGLLPSSSLIADTGA